MAQSTTSKRPGGEHRGNSYSRRARKFWLLATFGDGERCTCVHCEITLTYTTLEADRIVPGGSYRHENVQPACRHCNASRSNRLNWIAPKEATS